jgi:AP-1 complex subunit gamma-1
MGVGTASSGGVAEEVEDIVKSPATATRTAPASQNNVDLLADIFGSNDSPATQPQTHSPSTPSYGGNSLLDLLGSDQPSSPAPPTGLDSLAGLSSSLNASSPTTSSPSMNSASLAQESIPGYQAYTKNGLLIHLVPSRDRKNPAIINIQVLFNNDGSQGTITGLQFQAAVPKSQRLQMATASNTTIEPSVTEKQMMRINNPQQVKLNNSSVNKCQIDGSFFLCLIVDGREVAPAHILCALWAKDR